MSWNKKVNLEKLKEKAERAVVTDVERQLDKIRDSIFTKAQRMGGWNTYIFNLQKQNQTLSQTRDLLIPQLVTGKRELK